MALDAGLISVFWAFLGMLVSILLLVLLFHGDGVAAVIAAGCYRVISSDCRISSVITTSFLMLSCVLPLACLSVRLVVRSDIGPCEPL